MWEHKAKQILNRNDESDHFDYDTNTPDTGPEQNENNENDIEHKGHHNNIPDDNYADTNPNIKHHNNGKT